MDKHDETILLLGRIEGRLIEIGKLSERVSKVETSLAWLKGGWAAIVAGYVYVCRRL